MNEELEQIADRKVIGFAQHHPQVKEVIKGVGEDGQLSYSLMVDEFDLVVLDRTANLERNIYRRGISCEIQQWCDSGMAPNEHGVIYRQAA